MDFRCGVHPNLPLVELPTPLVVSPCLVRCVAAPHLDHAPTDLTPPTNLQPSPGYPSPTEVLHFILVCSSLSANSIQSPAISSCLDRWSRAHDSDTHDLQVHLNVPNILGQSSPRPGNGDDPGLELDIHTLGNGESLDGGEVLHFWWW